MRCLYCGKPLPLLKKLTGGGEFCSDAHRHKYQEEYNKLALSRLLQAQSSPGETGVFPLPGGGTGLRQLAAPPATGPGGMRALPAPEASPAPGAHQSFPSSAGSTAHHQVVATPPPSLPPSAPLRAAPPPPPPPPSVPDPKEAPFQIRQHEPIAPSGPPGLVQTDIEFLMEAAKPALWQESPPELPIVVPFEWETVQAAVQAAQEPDPPEAPAWKHPIEFHVPGEPQLAALAAFEFEAFLAKPIHPRLPEVEISTRYPQPVRTKIQLQSGFANMKLVRAELRLSGVRDWELNLSAPDWRPKFDTILAPAPVAVPVPLSKAESAAPRVATPSAARLEPSLVHDEGTRSQKHGNDAHVEVFIDLSILGILEDKPTGGARVG
jgi:hypothetical protein